MADSLDIFVSHATSDKRWARRLLERLRAVDRGVLTWFFDEETLRVGDEFPVAIAQAIERCKVFMVLASPDGLARPWVQREIELARQREDPPRFVVLTRGGATVEGLDNVLQQPAGGWVDRDAVAWRVIEACRAEAGHDPPTVGERLAAQRARLLAPLLVAAILLLVLLRMYWAPPPQDVPVVTLGFDSHRYLQQASALPPSVRCYARPVPLACIAAALDLLVDAHVERVAVDLDLGGVEPRRPDESAVLGQALQRAAAPEHGVRVLVPDDTPSQLRPPGGFGGTFAVGIETSNLLGGRASHVTIGESVPLALTLARRVSPPLGAKRALLPWTAAHDVARTGTIMVEELADVHVRAFLRDRAVILGARFDCPDGTLDCVPNDAPRRTIDELPVPRGPVGASRPVPGAQVHALLAGYARADGTLWGLHWLIASLFVAVGAIGGLGGPRGVPAAVLAGYLVLGVVGWPSGLVLSVGPALLLWLLDVVYRRFVW